MTFIGSFLGVDNSYLSVECGNVTVVRGYTPHPSSYSYLLLIHRRVYDTPVYTTINIKISRWTNSDL